MQKICTHHALVLKFNVVLSRDRTELLNAWSTSVSMPAIIFELAISARNNLRMQVRVVYYIDRFKKGREETIDLLPVDNRRT